jgi:hypothetical protein
LKKATPVSRSPSNHHLSGLAEDDAGDRLVLQQSTSMGSFQREREGPLFMEKTGTHLHLHHNSRHRSWALKKKRARSGQIQPTRSEHLLRA